MVIRSKTQKVQLVLAFNRTTKIFKLREMQASQIKTIFQTIHQKVSLHLWRKKKTSWGLWVIFDLMKAVIKCSLHLKTTFHHQLIKIAPLSKLAMLHQ